MATITQKIRKNCYWLSLVTIVATVIIILWSFPQHDQDQEEQVVPIEKQAASDKPSVADWETYQNEEYGFSFRYPQDYQKTANLWEFQQEGDLLWEWGVNRGQETIIAISLYPQEKKEGVFQQYGYQATGKIINLNNTVKGEKINMGNAADYDLLIDKEQVFFVISSSFTASPDSEEYKEYKTILDTLKI